MTSQKRLGTPGNVWAVSPSLYTKKALSISTIWTIRLIFNWISLKASCNKYKTPLENTPRDGSDSTHSSADWFATHPAGLWHISRLTNSCRPPMSLGAFSHGVLFMYVYLHVCSAVCQYPPGSPYFPIRNYAFFHSKSESCIVSRSQSSRATLSQCAHVAILTHWLIYGRNWCQIWNCGIWNLLWINIAWWNQWYKLHLPTRWLDLTICQHKWWLLCRTFNRILHTSVNVIPDLT